MLLIYTREQAVEETNSYRINKLLKGKMKSCDEDIVRKLQMESRRKNDRARNKSNK